MKLGPRWEFPYCPVMNRASYFIHSFNCAAFQYLQWILPPEFGLFLFWLVGWDFVVGLVGGFLLLLFWVGFFYLFCFVFSAKEDVCSPMEIRGKCSPPVSAYTRVPASLYALGHSQTRSFS